jgi:phage shock protein E
MIRLACVSLMLFAVAGHARDIPNPLIDYATFARQVQEVGKLRAQRRVSESQFIRMARDPDTVVLDARSAEKFALLHIRGARNLSLPDMTEEELARVIPSKTTRVLIYCNNNFASEPVALPTKAPPASLNVHTFTVLHAYGYTNVYELGPVIDVHRAKLTFAGSRASQGPIADSRP